MGFANQTVIVTSAGSGIGRGIATGLASAVFDVADAARFPADAEAERITGTELAVDGYLAGGR